MAAVLCQGAACAQPAMKSMRSRLACRRQTQVKVLMKAFHGRRLVGTRPPGFTLQAAEYTPKTNMLAYSLLIGVSARGRAHTRGNGVGLSAYMAANSETGCAVTGRGQTSEQPGQGSVRHPDPAV